MRIIAVFSIFFTCLLAGKAQENNTWRLGVQFGMHGNKSEFSGGMSDANARFHNNDFGSGELDLIARYDVDKHWMIQSGLGFSSVGFEYTIAENYSLLGKKKNYTTIRSELGTFQIPVMISYKFNPNCKNWKWFVSGGLAASFIGPQTLTSEAFRNNDGASNTVYLKSTNTSYSGAHLNVRFAVGREKVFQSGRIFSWSFIWNAGLNQIAKSDVVYTLDSQQYNHSFVNYGNFFGLRIAYFFKPLNNATRKVKPA